MNVCVCVMCKHITITLMTLVKLESREVVGGAQSLDHWLLISALLIMHD